MFLVRCRLIDALEILDSQLVGVRSESLRYFQLEVFNIPFDLA